MGSVAASAAGADEYRAVHDCEDADLIGDMSIVRSMMFSEILADKF